MKVIGLFFLLLFIISCRGYRVDSHESKVKYQTENCIADGNCTIEILRDSRLEFKTDEFGNSYPEIREGDKIVIRYRYKRNEIENVADSNYSEFILFELDNDKIDLHLQNENLQKVKLLFGRICFCRGATGYFKVTKGDLRVKSHKNKLGIDLRFGVDKIPQKIKSITETVPLK